MFIEACDVITENKKPDNYLSFNNLQLVIDYSIKYLGKNQTKPSKYNQ